MQHLINDLVGQFESGQINRRQLAAGLGTLVAVLGGRRLAMGQEENDSTFEAVGLNHIALRVTDVLRSREFYKKHLGMTVRRDGGERNCFLRAAMTSLHCFVVMNHGWTTIATRSRTTT